MFFSRWIRQTVAATTLTSLVVPVSLIQAAESLPLQSDSPVQKEVAPAVKPIHFKLAQGGKWLESSMTLMALRLKTSRFRSGLKVQKLAQRQPMNLVNSVLRDSSQENILWPQEKREPLTNCGLRTRLRRIRDRCSDDFRWKCCAWSNTSTKQTPGLRLCTCTVSVPDDRRDDRGWHRRWLCHRLQRQTTRNGHSGKSLMSGSIADFESFILISSNHPGRSSQTSTPG